MQPFTTLTATAVPLRAENVDTDQIIPARYLTAVTKAGMGDGLFAAWRYDADGKPKPEFVLNQPQYDGAEILIAGRNFGSGSSREHAVWALTEYGFRAVITPGFADIFYNNSPQERPAARDPARRHRATCCSTWSRNSRTPSLPVNLEAQTVTLPDGQQAHFAIDPYRKLCLLQGLDDLGYLLAQDEAIAALREAAHERTPMNRATSRRLRLRITQYVPAFPAALYRGDPEAAPAPCTQHKAAADPGEPAVSLRIDPDAAEALTAQIHEHLLLAPKARANTTPDAHSDRPSLPLAPHNQGNS